MLGNTYCSVNLGLHTFTMGIFNVLFLYNLRVAQSVAYTNDNLNFPIRVTDTGSNPTDFCTVVLFWARPTFLGGGGYAH